MLKDKFTKLCKNFSTDKELTLKLWQEIEDAYTQANRHYHTLKHLENIYNELPKLDFITEFSIFYHDIIYDVKRVDNEQKSALFCEDRLTCLNVDTSIIENTATLINETKTHNPNSKCNALFLDADLSILGSNEESYKEYTNQIRREYDIFTQSDYNIGRKKVLKHFLDKDRIYHTDYFYTKYEAKARENIENELKTLSLFTPN